MTSSVRSWVLWAFPLDAHTPPHTCQDTHAHACTHTHCRLHFSFIGSKMNTVHVFFCLFLSRSSHSLHQTSTSSTQRDTVGSCLFCIGIKKIQQLWRVHRIGSETSRRFINWFSSSTKCFPSEPKINGWKWGSIWLVAASTTYIRSSSSARVVSSCFFFLLVVSLPALTTFLHVRFPALQLSYSSPPCCRVALSVTKPLCVTDRCHLLLEFFSASASKSFPGSPVESCLVFHWHRL